MIYKRMFDYEKEFLKQEHLDRLEWMDYNTRVFCMPIIFKRAIDLMFEHHKLTYSDFCGIQRLRELIIIYEQQLTQCKTNEKPFSLIGSGVSNLIYPILKSVLELNTSKKEVVLFVPDYPIFHSVIETTNAIPVIIKSLRKNDYLPTMEQLENAVSNNTAAVLFANPNNPTGKMFSSDWTNKLVELAKHHDFFILSDEIYIEALYPENKPTHIAKINDGYKNYVKFFGLSKDRPGMTGIRCGYCIGDSRLLADAEKAQMTRNISNGIISDYLLLLDIALRYKNLSGIKHDDLKYYSDEELNNYFETIAKYKKMQRMFNDQVIDSLNQNRHVVDVIPPDGGNAVFFRYHKNLLAKKFISEFMTQALAAYPSEAFMLNASKDGSWSRVCVTRDIEMLKKAISKI